MLPVVVLSFWCVASQMGRPEPDYPNPKCTLAIMTHVPALKFVLAILILSRQCVYTYLKSNDHWKRVIWLSVGLEPLCMSCMSIELQSDQTQSPKSFPPMDYPWQQHQQN